MKSLRYEFTLQCVVPWSGDQYEFTLQCVESVAEAGMSSHFSVPGAVRKPV